MKEKGFSKDFIMVVIGQIISLFEKKRMKREKKENDEQYQK